MIRDEADEVIKKPFDSLKNRYQHNLGSIGIVSLSSIILSYCIMDVIK